MFTVVLGGGSGNVLTDFRFLSSLMPDGREFHTLLLRVAVYVVWCAALRASACMGI